MRHATLEEMLQARAEIGPFAAQVITAALKHNTVTQIMEVMLRFKGGSLTLPQMAEILFPSQDIAKRDQPAWLRQLTAEVKSTLIEYHLLYGTAETPIEILGTIQSSLLN